MYRSKAIKTKQRPCANVTYMNEHVCKEVVCGTGFEEINHNRRRQTGLTHCQVPTDCLPAGREQGLGR